MRQTYTDDGLLILSVHTPEFDHEKKRDLVVKATEKYHISNPVYMDNDHAYWRALSNRYWPAFYLFDKQGNLRHQTVGEMHNDSSRATTFDGLIRDLLAESFTPTR